MRKVVLDTNVLISGMIASGYSASILDAARCEEIKLVTSAHLLEEFSEVVSRRRIVRKYPQVAENAKSCLTFCVRFPSSHQASPNQTPPVATEMTISCWIVRWMKMRIVLSQATHICWI